MLPNTNKNIKLSLSFLGVLVLVYLVSQVFSGSLILPQFFSVGPITIHYYGLIMAAAVASGFYLALKRSSAYGVSTAEAEDLLFYSIIGGFIVARLYHVASSFPYYYQHPLDIIKVWNGGLSIYGAAIGGIIALVIYLRLLTTNYSLLTILDWLTPSFILGQIIGRFGNLFNYEAFGYPTNLPWKMFVPVEFRPESFQNFNFFHPFFLYELLGSTLILFLLLKVVKTKTPGTLFFFYLLLYNTLRFGLEFLRIDSTIIYGLRLNACVSLVLSIVSVLALISLTKMTKTTELSKNKMQ